MTFFKVATTSDLNDGEMKKVIANKIEIVLIKQNGKFYALQEYCSHKQAPLDEGTIDGKNLVCPWHSAIFDITTGKVSPDTNWATDLKKYNVKIQGKDILIDV